MSEIMKDVEDSNNPTFSTNCRKLKKIQVQKVLHHPVLLEISTINLSQIKLYKSVSILSICVRMQKYICKKFMKKYTCMDYELNVWFDGFRCTLRMYIFILSIHKKLSKTTMKCL